MSIENNYFKIFSGNKTYAGFDLTKGKGNYCVIFAVKSLRIEHVLRGRILKLDVEFEDKNVMQKCKNVLVNYMDFEDLGPINKMWERLNLSN